MGTDAFLVGLRYPHHARHSGYDGFARYVGVRVKAPVRMRRFPGGPGRAVDRALACALGQPKYSVGVLLAEAAAAAHMLRRERCLYHVMYGERDLLNYLLAFALADRQALLPKLALLAALSLNRARGSDVYREYRVPVLAMADNERDPSSDAYAVTAVAYSLYDRPNALEERRQQRRTRKAFFLVVDHP